MHPGRAYWRLAKGPHGQRNTELLALRRHRSHRHMPFDAQPQHVWSMVVVWGCLGPPQAPRRPEPDPPRKKHARPERQGRNSCPGAHVAAISARNDDTSLFFCAASARHAPSAPAQPPARALAATMRAQLDVHEQVLELAQAWRALTRARTEVSVVTDRTRRPHSMLGSCERFY